MPFGESNARSESEDNPHALTRAQSSSEWFDVYAAPSATFDARRDVPMALMTDDGRRVMRKRRGEVHRDGDWHRSAHVWIVDCERDVVVAQRRSPAKDTFPGMWDISAAGHVNSSETDSRMTAVGELAEELGVVIDGERLGAKQFTCPASQHELGGCNCYEDVYFLAWDIATEGEEFAIGRAEVTATKWVAIDDLERALESGDPEYVPRVPAYRAAFFPSLRAFVAARRRAHPGVGIADDRTS